MGVYGAFAQLFSYPDADVLARVDACLAEIPDTTEAGTSAARAALLAFRTQAARFGVPHLETAYTTAFDLDPACSLYVGHHVFGENARRSYFMWRLAELYRALGLPPDRTELPDHLPQVLRYIDSTPPGADRNDLLADAVVPALDRVNQTLGRLNHLYAPVVQAFLSFVAGPTAAETGRQETPA